MEQTVFERVRVVSRVRVSKGYLSVISSGRLDKCRTYQEYILRNVLKGRILQRESDESTRAVFLFSFSRGFIVTDTRHSSGLSLKFSRRVYRDVGRDSSSFLSSALPNR